MLGHRMFKVFWDPSFCSRALNLIESPLAAAKLECLSLPLHFFVSHKHHLPVQYSRFSYSFNMMLRRFFLQISVLLAAVYTVSAQFKVGLKMVLFVCPLLLLCLHYHSLFLVVDTVLLILCRCLLERYQIHGR